MGKAHRGEGMEALVFEIEGQRYGLPAYDVIELVRAVSIDPLPGAPPIIEGLVNIRGALAPVVSLRARFGLKRKDLQPQEHFIVARIGGRQVVVRTDRAMDLVRFAAEDVVVANDVSIGTELLAGVARLPDGLLLICDLQAFVSDAESAALDSALRQRSVQSGVQEEET